MTMKRGRAQGHVHLQRYMNWHMVCVFTAKPLLVCLLIIIVFTPHLYIYSFIYLFK